MGDVKMLDNLKNYHIILGSNSPRRKQLLGELDLTFEVRVIPDIDESYPADMPVLQIAEYIAGSKAAAYQPLLRQNDLLLTADTVVLLGERVMGKPENDAAARQMLHDLSGQTHQVVTGVCLTTCQRQRRFSVVTDVSFGLLTDEEIAYYVEHYHPLDKAGAYGIQEWIGHIAVTGLHGSYFNVMGLPVQRIYQELKNF